MGKVPVLASPLAVAAAYSLCAFSCGYTLYCFSRTPGVGPLPFHVSGGSCFLVCRRRCRRRRRGAFGYPGGLAEGTLAGAAGVDGGAGRGHRRRRSLRPGPRHGLGAGEHALPASAGQRGRGRAGRPVRQQHERRHAASALHAAHRQQHVRQPRLLAVWLPRPGAVQHAAPLLLGYYLSRHFRSLLLCQNTAPHVQTCQAIQWTFIHSNHTQAHVHMAISVRVHANLKV